MRIMGVVVTIMILLTVMTIITQIIFWSIRNYNRKNILIIWDQFIEASQANDIDSILFFGDKLIWNRYVSQNQIDKINLILSSKINDNLELVKLYEISEKRHSYLSDQERQIMGLQINE